MKVGDLVLCTFQPKTERVMDGYCLPMNYTLKGEFGIIKRIQNGLHLVIFPSVGYSHWLSHSALEEASETS
jgi:hypothetical protein